MTRWRRAKKSKNERRSCISSRMMKPRTNRATKAMPKTKSGPPIERICRLAKMMTRIRTTRRAVDPDIRRMARAMMRKTSRSSQRDTNTRTYRSIFRILGVSRSTDSARSKIAAMGSSTARASRVGRSRSTKKRLLSAYLMGSGRCATAGGDRCGLGASVSLFLLQDEHLDGLDPVLALEGLRHRGRLGALAFHEEDLHARALPRLVVDVGLDDIIKAVLDPRDRFLTLFAVRHDDHRVRGPRDGLLLPDIRDQEAEGRPDELRVPAEPLGLLEILHRLDHGVGHRHAEDRHGRDKLIAPYKE